MRAEAVSWDDWSANNAPPIVEDEKWHVALAPGEVKVVSLEQLDDLYRLSIVDSETKVWQTGMSEWQPLRVIAGLDDAPAPEPKRTHPRPPSPRSAPPPPRPPSRAPAPQYAQPIAFAATQPAFVAPLPVPAAMPALHSVRPLVVSARPMPPRSGGGFGRFLIGLAVLGGVGVTAYRNGLLHDVASAQHFEGAFGRLEAALGGPSFGTLRAVEKSTATAALTLQPMLNASLPSEAARPARVEPTAAPAAPPVTQAAQPPVVSLESIKPESGAAARPKLEPASPRAETAPRAEAAPKAAVAAPAKAVVEKAAPPPPPKPAVNTANMTERERLNAAIGQAMSSSPLSPSTKGKAGSKSKASEYDPLNPKL